MADAPPPSLPTELPVLPLRRTVAFPLTLQPLAVNRPVSVESVNRALGSDRLVLLLLQHSDSDDPGPQDVVRVGTVGVIRQMAKSGGGVNIIIEGVARVRAEIVTRTGTSMRARVTPMPEPVERTIEVEAHVRRLQELIEKALSLATGLSEELRAVVINIDDPLRLVYVLATLLDLKPADKQALLEEDNLLKKLEAIAASLTREISLLELKGKIESQAQQEMSDAQRQYYLRQQLKAIQQELGEGEGTELAELRKRIDDAKLSEAIHTAAMREVDRLSRMGPASPEYQMLRTYIDWLLDVPWAVTTTDRIDPVEARKVLDEDHYDLDKVKERIVEYLAVRKLKGDMKGPILCFVGPPGVGKTSLGQSIARAMVRKFVRLSLGGVRDEAEIRGHRRTYIGSIPGRIVQALKQAGSMNPVFMLDEIDKVSVGFQGDPAAALLEVLDPAQNHTFRDHYLEVPVDLSRVLFIATSNQLGTIHPALLDRMEIIQLSGYTEDEKVHIARKYLVPRQMNEHGLPEGAIELTEAALRLVIADYTREAGVRNLERQIGTICRKVAARLATRPADAPPPEKAVVDRADVDDYLGPARFKKEMAFRTSRPGVATGVAWTETGGDVLFIEATLLPGGNQNIILTGQLGNVMQESARAALSHLRARAGELGIAPEFLAKHDLHVHVPAGAIPKDGPSAGVTMATAILSAARNRPVRRDVAMTGEITLSGLVLPVGGIREKALAARRFGIRTLILPALNEPDLEELPPDIRREMTFVPVETLDQVIKVAMPDGGTVNELESQEVRTEAQPDR
ncbi:MAG: endopeptidase La [Acidobacteria bacterium]|nr:endopeptidase La [Acidobacteriota bacterium]